MKFFLKQQLFLSLRCLEVTAEFPVDMVSNEKLTLVDRKYRLHWKHFSGGV